MAIVMAACASPQAQIETASAIKALDDPFRPYREYSTGKIQGGNPLGPGIGSGINEKQLAARVDRKTGAVATFLEFEIAYTGAIRRSYERATNIRAETLPITVLAHRTPPTATVRPARAPISNCCTSPFRKATCVLPGPTAIRSSSSRELGPISKSLLPRNSLWLCSRRSIRIGRHSLPRPLAARSSTLHSAEAIESVKAGISPAFRAASSLPRSEGESARQGE